MRAWGELATLLVSSGQVNKQIIMQFVHGLINPFKAVVFATGGGARPEGRIDISPDQGTGAPPAHVVPAQARTLADVSAAGAVAC